MFVYVYKASNLLYNGKKNNSSWKNVEKINKAI